MAFYKVLVIKMLLPNNTVVENNDIVDEELFSNVKALEKGGYIKKASKSEIEDFNKKKKSENKSDLNEKAKAEAEAKAQAEAEAQEKANQEAKLKAEAEAKAKAKEENSGK